MKCLMLSPDSQVFTVLLFFSRWRTTKVIRTTVKKESIIFSLSQYVVYRQQSGYQILPYWLKSTSFSEFYFPFLSTLIFELGEIFKFKILPLTM